MNINTLKPAKRHPVDKKLKRYNMYILISRIMMFYLWGISFIMYLTEQINGMLTTQQITMRVAAHVLWLVSIFLTLRFPKVFMSILTLGCIVFIFVHPSKPHQLHSRPPVDFVAPSYFITFLCVCIAVWMAIATAGAFKAENLKKQLA